MAMPSSSFLCHRLSFWIGPYEMSLEPFMKMNTSETCILDVVNLPKLPGV
jgi:hypothetical protein